MSLSIRWTDLRTEALPEGGDREVMEFSLLELDIIEQDTYDIALRISTHAAEEGVPFSDHAEPEQEKASVTINVSGRQSSTHFVDGASLGTFELPSGSEGQGIIVPEGTDRIGDCFESLRRLARESIEVDIDGLRRPIEGWLIERVSSPRTTDTVGLLVCEITFVEIRYADVEEVDAPSPRVERGRRSRDQGRQGTEESSDDDVSVPTAATDHDTAVSALEQSARWAGI